MTTPPYLPLAGLCLLIPATHAATVSGASTTWTEIVGNYDYFADQQTGVPAGDIVGTGSDPGFFTTLNDNGPTLDTDGTLGFRLRLDASGGSTNKPAFDRAAWVGIDADIDGSIDVFLGINFSGSSRDLGLFAPGSDQNISPSTTSISSAAYRTYSVTTDNYSYRPVNFTTDGGTSNDLTGNGDPDYYVSFMVPFADVVSFLAANAIDVTDQSPLRYVTATATQGNSLNQDLGGVNGGVSSSTTWTNLGGFSQIVDASGVVVDDSVPEPSSVLLALGMFAGGLRIRRRR